MLTGKFRILVGQPNIFFDEVDFALFILNCSIMWILNPIKFHVRELHNCNKFYLSSLSLEIGTVHLYETGDCVPVPCGSNGCSV